MLTLLTVQFQICQIMLEDIKKMHQTILLAAHDRNALLI